MAQVTQKDFNTAENELADFRDQIGHELHVAQQKFHNKSFYVQSILGRLRATTDIYGRLLDAKTLHALNKLRRLNGIDEVGN